MIFINFLIYKSRRKGKKTRLSVKIEINGTSQKQKTN